MRLLAWANLFCALASGALSVTIIAVIRSELWFSSGWWWNGWWYTSTSSVCYMTTGAVSANICTYGYWVGAVGIFCSFFLFFTGITKLTPRYRTRRIFEVLIIAFGIVWWLPFAVTSTVYGIRANDVNLPYEHWRKTVYGLAWAIFSLYIIQLAIVLTDWKNYGKEPEIPQVPMTQYPPQQQQYPAYPPAPGYGAQQYNYNPAYQQPPYGQQQAPPYGGPTVTGYPQPQDQNPPRV